MRIIYFHQYFATREGSTGTRSFEFAKALVAAGHEVTMVCASGPRAKTGLDGPFDRGVREGMVEGFRVIQYNIEVSNNQGVGTRILQFSRYALGALWQALSRDYDLVFATSTPLSAAIPGIAAKLLRRKRFVFEVRDLWPELPRALGMKNPVLLGGMSALEWPAYRMADRCIGLAPGIAEGIKRRARDHLPVDMIPNGCDVELFDGAPPKRHPAASQGDLLALFCGAHGLANGLGAVLDAGVELQRRGETGIKLLLIGDGAQKGMLQDRARREGLENVVFADLIPKTELVGFIKGADVGLQILADVPAFYHGTSPNKFFDYLSAGIPVLTNYPGWVAGLVTSNNAGWAVPAGQPSAFADALVWARDHRGALPAMGQNARNLAGRDFARATQADRFVASLEQALRA